MKDNILVIGHGSHGKTTVAEWMLKTFGITYTESSKFMTPYVRDFARHTTTYPSDSACYEDRRNNRKLWEHVIAAYNSLPGFILADEILKSYDCYCGMRRQDEAEKVLDRFDLVIWVEAMERTGYVDPTFSIDYVWMQNNAPVMYTVDNNGEPGSWELPLKHYLIARGHRLITDKTK